MAHLPIEQVRVLFLNAKNMLIANEAMWRGRSTRPRSMSAKSSPAPSRSARPRSSSSTTTRRGDPSPSQQDIRLTRDLVEAGRHMQVTVHDHVIVGASGRTSMKALGLI